MKDLVTFLVTSIVDNPDKVGVADQQTPEGLLITVRVDQADMGRIIGKQGKVIGAIRQIAKAAAVKSGQHINIQLAENAN